jgi:pyridoxamine 5'-phosphate oxidase
MNEIALEDPIDLFRRLLREAEGSEPKDANAAALATADATGAPSVRMVLVKDIEARGVTFYTNIESRKGEELRANPRAALCLYWKSLGRQVRLEGPVSPVSDEEADAYFATRQRQSQIGAWASQQSRPLDGVLLLERRAAEYALKFGLKPVPRPPFWTGFRLVPARLEFWTEKPFRLHERVVFLRGDRGWRTERLFP